MIAGIESEPTLDQLTTVELVEAWEASLAAENARLRRLLGYRPRRHLRLVDNEGRGTPHPKRGSIE